MTDISPKQAENNNNLVDDLTTDRPITTESSDTANPRRDARQAIQDVISRYVGQLIEGCGDSSCIENFCDTGRRNINQQQPTRRYTSLTARAIALTVVSGPNPRSRLCPRYVLKAGSHVLDSPERPRDPTAFMQQLVDTPVIQRLITTSTSRDPDNEGSRTGKTSDQCIQTWHSRLDQISDSMSEPSATSLGDIVAGYNSVADSLHSYVLTVVRTFPAGDVHQWMFANAVISSGSAYPSPNLALPGKLQPEVSLDVFDALEYRPMLNLFCRVLAIAEKRIENERTLYQAKAQELGVRTCDERFPWLMKELGAHIAKPIHVVQILPYIVLVKKTFLQHWNGELHIERKGIDWMTLILLSRIHAQLRSKPADRENSDRLLLIPAVAGRVDAVELAQAFMKRDDHRPSICLLAYGFVFTMAQRIIYFRTMNHLRMRKAHSDARKVSALSGMALTHAVPENLNSEDRLEYLEDHYLLLDISRQDVLQDAFDQLWHRRAGELLRPLRVRLGELDQFEIGHDLGGVQIEFFNVLCKELFKEEKQIFTTDPDTGLSYFCPGSLQPLYMFELCGLLFALAFYNGITLPVSFPKAFYSVLTRSTYDLANRHIEAIADGWPTVSRSLDNILRDNFYNLDSVFHLEANGLRLAVKIPLDTIPPPSELQIVELSPILDRNGSTSAKNHDIDITNIAWPGWKLFKASAEPEDITAANKMAYVKQYVLWLTMYCVQPQWQAFMSGFDRILPHHLLIMLSPEGLQAALEGSTHLDLNELRRATTYDGYDPLGTYIESFWRLIAEWPVEKQKQLIKFVTATERIPAGGVSNLQFNIQRAKPNSLDHLPSSSTCFGTLMLPKYPSVEILDEKLSAALEFGVEGFGYG